MGILVCCGRVEWFGIVGSDWEIIELVVIDIELDHCFTDHKLQVKDPVKTSLTAMSPSSTQTVEAGKGEGSGSCGVPAPTVLSRSNTQIYSV